MGVAVLRVSWSDVGTLCTVVYEYRIIRHPGFFQPSPNGWRDAGNAIRQSAIVPPP